MPKPNKEQKVCQETWKDKKETFIGRGRSKEIEADGEEINTNKDRCGCVMTHMNRRQVLKIITVFYKHAIIWKRARNTHYTQHDQSQMEMVTVACLQSSGRQLEFD